MYQFDQGVILDLIVDSVYFSICNISSYYHTQKYTIMATVNNKLTLSTIATNQLLNFSEFGVYDQNGVNIALLGTASQTSTFRDETFGASVAINGDTSSSFAATNGAGIWTLNLAQSYLKSELISATFYNQPNGYRWRRNPRNWHGGHVTLFGRPDIH